MKISIRPAEPGDFATVFAFVRRLVPHCQEAALKPFYQLHVANPDYEIFLAEADGEPAGIVSLATLPALHAGGKIGVLNELVVAERFQRMGVAYALIETVRHHCHDRGLLALEFSNALARAATGSFFEKAGFSASGTFYRQVF